MKAGQLAKILQCVEPDADVSFSVCYDKDDREELVSQIGNDPDYLTDMKASVVELDDFSFGTMNVEICIFPTGQIKR